MEEETVPASRFKQLKIQRDYRESQMLVIQLITEGKHKEAREALDRLISEHG